LFPASKFRCRLSTPHSSDSWINSPCSTVLLNSSRTCNCPRHNPPHPARGSGFAAVSADTVRGLAMDLPAFSCQRTFALIPSERPDSSGIFRSRKTRFELCTPGK